MGNFPNRESAVRLVGVVLAEQHDEWAEMRRYIGLEVLSRVRLGIIHRDTPENPFEQVAPAALTA